MSPIGTFLGNPDNADRQQYPTSSNFAAPSSRNSGQDAMNNKDRQSFSSHNTLSGKSTGAVEDLCTSLALSRLSLSEAGSGQNWTSPSLANPDVSHSTADATETEVAQRSDDLPSETQVNKEVESGHVSPSQALARPFIGALAIASDETVSNLNACGYSPQIISFLQAHNRPMQHHSLNAVVLLDQDSPVPRQPAYLLAILIHPAKLNPKKVLVDLIMTQTKIQKKGKTRQSLWNHPKSLSRKILKTRTT